MTFKIDTIRRTLNAVKAETEKVLDRKPMYDDIRERTDGLGNIEFAIRQGDTVDEDLPVSIYIEINGKTAKDAMEALVMVSDMIADGNTKVMITNDKVDLVAMGPGLGEPEDQCHG